MFYDTSDQLKLLSDYILGTFKVLLVNGTNANRPITMLYTIGLV
jgi:hypothetical protein